MKIDISRKDAVHILNWLNHYQQMSLKNGFHYLHSDIENVMNNFAVQLNQNGMNVTRRSEIPCWHWKSLPDDWFMSNH